MTSKEIDELSNKFRELTKTSKNRLGHRNDVISLLKQYSEYPQADGTTVDKTKELIALANAMQENPVLNYNALAPYLIAVERRYKYPDVETFLTKLEKYPMALKYGTDRIKKLIALLKEKGMTPELQKLIKKAKELEKTPMFSQANLLYLKNEELAEKLTVDNINRYVDIHNKALKSNKYYNSDCCDEFSLYISTLPDDKTKWAKAWDEIEKRLVGV